MAVNNVFSDTYITSGEALALELVRGSSNETISYGPDFSRYWSISH